MWNNNSLINRFFDVRFPDFGYYEDYYAEPINQHVALPGLTKKDVSIKVSGNKVYIEINTDDYQDGDYQKKYEGVRKVFLATPKHNMEKVEAELKDGLLVIKIPLKDEIIPKERQIALN
jgi:HSP20 family molecular chaperone IbpA